MPLRFAVVVFPGTWSDHDTHYALTAVLGQGADLVWHRQRDLSSYDVIVLPGGFSYGDYLRAGAIGRFSPVMEAVSAHAEAGKPLIGICNGFQLLCEAHLLPGALVRNESLQYRCLWLHLRVENAQTPFTQACQPGQVLRLPISHGEGRYVADEETLAELESVGGGGVPLLRRGGRGDGRGEPQRQHERHRRHRKRAGERAGDDAPPGAGLRAADGRGRRPGAVAIVAGVGKGEGVTHRSASCGGRGSLRIETGSENGG